MLGEVELVRAVEEAPVGELVGHHAPALQRRPAPWIQSSRVDLPRPIIVTSRVRPQMLMPSMLMLAARRPAGTGGCAARYFEPSRPCSSRGHRREEHAAARRAAGARPWPWRWRASPPRPTRCRARRCRSRPRPAWRRLRACRGDRGARCRARPRCASAGSLPGSRPITFAVCFRLTVVLRARSTSVTPRGTGRKSRFCAAARSASRSCPPSGPACRDGVLGGPGLAPASCGSPSCGSANCSPRPRASARPATGSRRRARCG